MIFNLPDVGEGLAEAEIVQWLVAEGDTVNAGDPMVSVETDKAVVEIPAPESGTVIKHFADVGEVVATGSPLVELQTAEQVVQHDTKASTSVVGELETSEETLVEQASQVEPVRGLAEPSKARVTPAVRALAKQLGVELSLVTPTGPQATILKRDVERVANRLQRYGPSEKLRGPRRAMAAAMTKAHAEVVPATLIDDVSVQHWRDDTDVTLRLLHAITAACQIEPALNAWFDSHAMARRVFDHVDVAVAMDTIHGLFTPVVRHVAGRDDDELRETIDRLEKDVQHRRVSREDLREYTITLTNYGTVGGRYAVPVVVPPTVAIVGAGRIYQGVTVVDDNPVVHNLLPLTLTFDHRAVTGGEAGRFFEAFKAALGAL